MEPDAHHQADEAFAALFVGGLLAAAEHRLEGGVEYASTGWSRLDAALGGGLLIPSLNVLGAGPKAFKSTWAQIVAERHVEEGGVCYHLDVENGRMRFLRRMLCRRARLGAKEVVRGLSDDRAGIFTSREAVQRWKEAKESVRTTMQGLHAEFRPPPDFKARVVAARRAAGDRKLLVVDFLQKLPMDFADRRSSVGRWLRFFEGLRHERRGVSTRERDPSGPRRLPAWRR